MRFRYLKAFRRGIPYSLEFSKMLAEVVWPEVIIVPSFLSFFLGGGRFAVLLLLT